VIEIGENLDRETDAGEATGSEDNGNLWGREDGPLEQRRGIDFHQPTLPARTGLGAQGEVVSVRIASHGRRNATPRGSSLPPASFHAAAFCSA